MLSVPITLGASLYAGQFGILKSALAIVFIHFQQHLRPSPFHRSSSIFLWPDFPRAVPQKTKKKPHQLALTMSKGQHHHFFNSPAWDFELTRLLGTAPTGGCDAAEFLQAVGELRRHDGESWYAAWSRQAETAHAAAHEAARAGLGPLARGFFLRACNYWRVAPYMLAGVVSPGPASEPGLLQSDKDTRSADCLRRSAEAFDQATAYMDARVLNLVVSFRPDDGGGGVVDMPARLLLPPEAKRLKKQQKTPVVVCVGGADSTMQEMFFWLGAAGTELGYAVLLFNGPGQGDVVFGPRAGESGERGGGGGGGRTLLRPDFEGVVSAVLDHLWALAADRADLRLDLGRVALAGLSMGAHFALRTAAADPRVAAVVAGDPILDMWELALTRLPGWFARGWLAGWVPDAVLNASCRASMRLDFPTRWEFNTTMALMGQASPADLLREFRRYTLLGTISNPGKRRAGVEAAAAAAAAADGNNGGVAIVPDSHPSADDHDEETNQEEEEEDEPHVPLLSCITCPVFLTGASTALYQDAETTTARLARALVRVPPRRLDVWVPGSVAEGALTAKVGAWYHMACKAFVFLDRQWDIARQSPR